MSLRNDRKKSGEISRQQLADGSNCAPLHKEPPTDSNRPDMKSSTFKTPKSFYFPKKLDSFLAPPPPRPRQLNKCLSDRCCMSDIVALHPDGCNPTFSGVGQTDV